MGTLLSKAVQPFNPKRNRTFSIWETQHQIYETGILDQFEQHQVRLKQAITDLNHLLEAIALLFSPANRYILIKLARVYDILVAHEERHYNLARQLYEAVAS